MKKEKSNQYTVLIRVFVLFALVLLILGAALLFGDFYDAMGPFFSIAFSVLGVSFVFGLTNARFGFKLFLPLIVGLLCLAYTVIFMKEPNDTVLDIFYFTLYYGGISVVSVGVGSLINLIVRLIAKKVKLKKHN